MKIFRRGREEWTWTFGLKTWTMKKKKPDFGQCVQSLKFRHKLENRMNTRRTITRRCSKNLVNGKTWMTSNRMYRCKMQYLLSLHTVLQLIIVGMWLQYIEKWENPIEIFSSAKDQLKSSFVVLNHTTGWQVGNIWSYQVNMLTRSSPFQFFSCVSPHFWVWSS